MGTLPVEKSPIIGSSEWILQTQLQKSQPASRGPLYAQSAASPEPRANRVPMEFLLEFQQLREVSPQSHGDFSSRVSSRLSNS